MARTIDLVTDSFAGRFARAEPRRAAVGSVTGLLADLMDIVAPCRRTAVTLAPGLVVG